MFEQVRWITDERFAQQVPQDLFHKQYEKNNYKPDEGLKNRHILFRRSFLCSEVVQSLINISADDYYKLYINGIFVAQGPAPGHKSRYYYNQINITDYLKKGKNIIAVHTYYQGLINRVWVSGDKMHGLWLELVSNGKRILESDESFLVQEHTGFCASHIMGYDTQFAENYDSNAAECRFYHADFDDSGWSNALFRINAPYVMVKQPTQLLDIYRAKPEVTCLDNIVLFDMGQTIVGYLSLKALGLKHSRIEIRFGDELNSDGSLRYNLRSNCLYKEHWILSGGEDELDMFDYKAFRYGEIILPKDCRLDMESLSVIVRHYPYKDFSSFQTTDHKLNKIVGLIKNTIKYGIQEVYFDCPQREKGQYSGDGFYIGVVHSLITRDFSMFKKFITNIADTRAICPGLMAQAPCSFMQEIADFSLQFPTTLLAYYALSKDKSTLEEMLPVAENMLAYFRGFEDSDGLLKAVDKWNLVDWPANSRDDYDADLAQDGNYLTRTVKHNVINAFYIGAIKSVNKIRAICGQRTKHDISKHEKAFIKKFYDADKKLFKDSEVSSHISVHSNVLPLHLNIGINDDNQKTILELIRQKRLDRCNIFGAFQTFCALKRVGEQEFIVDLIKDEKYWLNMIKEGATTTFEAWGKDAKWNTALFHLAFVLPFMFLEDWDIDYMFV